ncbi:MULTISPECIES: hypothetical protein [Pseudomonas]|uniref:Uncharacterized protein n=1 Tax=Pseudomonas fortuita TaxID=3233375 RepID=A0ACD4NZY8_9PSED|nr:MULTISPECIES: hypothetical protein [Pseudomonas]MBP2082955.1 hypothetical protein [Pseudomonas sp. PvP089]MBP2091342.1 hypothetical protein [Pseudomonas sp. PvP088]MBP2222495.1 hypothetical protein [Pseudomonas putida]MDZ4021505.1 hypothetical protein [Pseudomonas sichuanensis]QQE86350.1 hypothetical protein JET17_11995 [Pseudomonas putida]
MRVHSKIASVLLLLGASMSIFADDCGVPGAIVGKLDKKKIDLKARFFQDGSIAVRARLSVNPDGGPGSYTVGDHGFTYIANGLSAWRNGKRHECDIPCSKEFRKAESKGFETGTTEFCVFAMEVEPLEPGRGLVSCGDGRLVIGNGKGKPKLGGMLDTVTGKQVRSYVSTTSSRHTIEGVVQHLDSETLPIAVTPRTDLLGKVVWIGGTGYRSTYAIIGDKGPAFGEGSIALHQLLRTGVISEQKSGPIALEDRCGAGELGLRPPFQSRPDRPSDKCRPGYTAKSPSDIRAYTGIIEELDFVVLGDAKFQMDGRIITEAVSAESIKSTADKAGYTKEAIDKMLACLPR